jgi:hypothetical protein
VRPSIVTTVVEIHPDLRSAIQGGPRTAAAFGKFDSSAIARDARFRGKLLTEVAKVDARYNKILGRLEAELAALEKEAVATEVAHKREGFEIRRAKERRERELSKYGEGLMGSTLGTISESVRGLGNRVASVSRSVSKAGSASHQGPVVALPPGFEPSRDTFAGDEDDTSLTSVQQNPPSVASAPSFSRPMNARMSSMDFRGIDRADAKRRNEGSEVPQSAGNFGTSVGTANV